MIIKRKIIIAILLLAFSASVISCSGTRRSMKPKGYYSNGCRCPLRF